MPIVSNAAASKGPVFTEAAVPKIPASALSLVPIEIGGVAALVVGIALVAAGTGEALHVPPVEGIGGTKLSRTSRSNRAENKDIGAV
jgi:hypothetical protein